MSAKNGKEVLGIAAVVVAALIAVTFIPKAFSAPALSSSVMEGLVSTTETSGDGVIALLDKPEQCEFKKAIATTLMTKHQNNDEFKSTYAQLKTDFSKTVMSYAWQTPVKVSEQEKVQVIEAFGQQIFDECINGKKSVHLDH